MKYYSALYMKNGEIHLRPHDTKEAAEKTIQDVMNTKWGPLLSKAKTYKGDVRITLPLKNE